MPKPYTAIPNDAYAFGIHAMKARPTLAQHMANIIQESSMANIQLANILSLIAHIDARPAITMYAAIRNDGARDAALRAVGEEMLQDDIKKRELAKILKKFSKCEEKRNLIAHGVWFASKLSTDVLLYLDPAEYIKWKSAMNVAGAKDDSKQFLKLLIEDNVLLKRMISYDENDFLDMECRYDLLMKRMVTFGYALM